VNVVAPGASAIAASYIVASSIVAKGDDKRLAMRSGGRGTRAINIG
jgi:hypothetical protein